MNYTGKKSRWKRLNTPRRNSKGKNKEEEESDTG
jgi:hypothetical protein